MPLPLRPVLPLTTAAALALGLLAGNPATRPLLRQAVAGQPVAEERREGYTRTGFKHWIDADCGPSPRCRGRPG
ncbi:hypothetical protein ACWDWV_00225 [Streptosporangium sandarakinum]